MKQWLIERKFYVAMAVLIVSGSIYYVYNQQNQASDQQFSQLEKQSAAMLETKGQSEKQQPPQKTDIMIVDVKGAIKKPGVYQVSEKERVNDVILRAGGLTEEADSSQVNFAAKVQDEMVIYVPAKGEVQPAPPQTSAVAASSPQPGNTKSGVTGKGKVNLNKADASELETLPGVGPAKAAAILDFRKQNGSFQSPDDLKKISGIGDKTFEKLKDLITVR
ncbi:helix-hairpin-helix domain-containing protein [Bacillota bacterium Lsc_1132]